DRNTGAAPPCGCLEASGDVQRHRYARRREGESCTPNALAEDTQPIRDREREDRQTFEIVDGPMRVVGPAEIEKEESRRIRDRQPCDERQLPEPDRDEGKQGDAPVSPLRTSQLLQQRRSNSRKPSRDMTDMHASNFLVGDRGRGRQRKPWRS